MKWIDFDIKAPESVIYPDVPTIVVLDKCGPLNKNQVNGVCCDQNSCRGWSYPLSFLDDDEQIDISPCLCSSSNRRNARDRIQRILDKYNLQAIVRDMTEGWVTLDMVVDGQKKSAVLMYNNCD